MRLFCLAMIAASSSGAGVYAATVTLGPVGAIKYVNPYDTDGDLNGTATINYGNPANGATDGWAPAAYPLINAVDRTDGRNFQDLNTPAWLRLTDSGRLGEPAFMQFTAP